MRRILFTLACWFVLTLIAVDKEVVAAPDEVRRPNIIYILADDKN